MERSDGIQEKLDVGSGTKENVGGAYVFWLWDGRNGDLLT
jgi:hypothetical protein